MAKKYLLVSLEDEKTKHLAEVLGNKTCKKIIDFLAETKEASEKDIADALHMPLNTAEYNLNKLIKSEIVEKTKNFFWSKKGKKIPMYALSNKSIVISPKSSRVSSKLKSIIPVAIVSGAAAFLIKVFSTATQTNTAGADEVLYKAALDAATESAPQAATTGARLAQDSATIFTASQPFPIWGWFLVGAALAILIYSILNWRKMQ